MSITISVGGTAISSEIHFTEMAPWFGQPKCVTHTIDGADYDVIIHTGNKSDSTSISGYCKRTAANITELKKLCTGDILTITHSVEGTKTGICTALQPKASGGGLFITFTMTVVEQE